MFKSVAVGRAATPDVLIVGVFQPEPSSAKSKAAASAKKPAPKLDPQTAKLDADGVIAGALARPECTGETGRIVEAFPASGKPAARILIVGLGRQSKLEARSFFTIGASIGRKLGAIKAQRAAFDLAGPLAQTKVKPAHAAQALGEAIGLLAYDTDAFKGSASTPRDKQKLVLSAPAADFAKALERGLALAESTNYARMLSQTPPNICNPKWVAAEARRLAREHAGLSVRILAGEDLKREKLHGLIEVGKASDSPPALIRLEWKPAGASGKPIVLVGKTLTYDTGGLSLKVGGSMPGMKRDMDGGAAVLGAMHAIASVVKPKRHIVALLAAAENSVSSNAYRPDDIITFRNGVSVEITNTDAEGRLVLADALCWACDKEKPRCIVDLATLTGGVVTALGSTFAGMWCDDDALRAGIESASAATGERVWRLPHHQEYRDMMKSDVADILNSNPNRKAHPIQGAAFLSYFVDEETPWCHLDIAGVHAAEGDSGPYAKGTATGWGVRLLAELVESM